MRIGRERSRELYVAMIALAYVMLPIALIAGDGSGWAMLGLLSLPLAIAPVRAVRERTDGPALNGALAGTGALLGAFALLVSVGLLI